MLLIPALLLATAPLGPCTVTDGDTIRCGAERIRLVGIDAPELPGHCRRGRRCAAGDPQASRASLAAALTGPLTIQRTGTDQYGRTLALVSGARGDLSCWQLRHRAAIYKPNWDTGRRLARLCRSKSASVDFNISGATPATRAATNRTTAFHGPSAFVVKRQIIFAGIPLSWPGFALGDHGHQPKGDRLQAAFGNILFGHPELPLPRRCGHTSDRSSSCQAT